MQFVCDAPNGTWFRIETEGEAIKESQLMNHAVEKHFRRAAEEAELAGHASDTEARAAHLRLQRAYTERASIGDRVREAEESLG